MALRSSGLLNGGASTIDDEIGADVDRLDLADRGRVLRLDVLDQRGRHLGRESHVDLAGDEGQHRGRAVLDDGVFDAVEIRQALFPVVRILHELDRLVLLHLDELERAGADRMRAHLRGGNVAGVDRRIAGGQHRQQRRLRPLEMEGRFEVAVDRDVRDEFEPILARILAELVLRFALQQVEGAFHVLGRERHAVVPFHALAQLEGERGAGFVPGPAGRQLGHDGVDAGLRLVLIVDDQIVEDAHRGGVDREGRLLVNREAGRRFAVIDFQNAAVFRLRRLSVAEREASENSGRQRDEFRSHWILPRMHGCRDQDRPAACFLLFVTVTLPGMVAPINSTKVLPGCAKLPPLANDAAAPHDGADEEARERQW